MREMHFVDRDPLIISSRAGARGRDSRQALQALAAVVGALVLGACGSSGSSTSSSAPDITAAPITATTVPTVAPVTTVTTMAPVTTFTTMPPVSVTTVRLPVITAPPGRLPPVDDTVTITALFSTPFPTQDPLSLATETILRLRDSFEATGFSADVAALSLVGIESDDQTLGSVMAFVVEVRNLEASGDDSSPGFDLIFTMKRGDAGNWTITKAVQQQICSRGVSMSSDPPLCV